MSRLEESQLPEMQTRLDNLERSNWHLQFEVNSLRRTNDVIKEITAESQKKLRVIVTGAKKAPQSIGYEALKKELQQEEPSLLVFGTGWGLEKNLIQNADHALLPIEGINGFNHLPVRGAIAIILDRLLGLRESSVD